MGRLRSALEAVSQSYGRATRDRAQHGSVAYEPFRPEPEPAAVPRAKPAPVPKPKPRPAIARGFFTRKRFAAMMAFLAILFAMEIHHQATEQERRSTLTARELFLEDFDDYSNGIQPGTREATERKVAREAKALAKAEPNFLAAMMICHIEGHEVHFVSPGGGEILKHVERNAPLEPAYDRARQILLSAPRFSHLRVLIYRDTLQIIGNRGEVIKEEKVR